MCISHRDLVHSHLRSCGSCTNVGNISMDPNSKTTKLKRIHMSGSIEYLNRDLPQKRPRFDNEEDKSGDYEPSQEESVSSPEISQYTRRRKKGNEKKLPGVSNGPPPIALADHKLKNKEEFGASPRDLVRKLGISDEAVISIFKGVRIRLSMDRIEIPSRKGNGETKWYCASTVTREVLQTHSVWDFDDEFTWEINVTPMPASDVYQPLPMDSVLLDINESPVRAHGPDRPYPNLHIQILRALRGMRKCMESIELKLYLPEDWGMEGHLNASLDSILELPREYMAALNCQQAESEVGSQGVKVATTVAPTWIESPKRRREKRQWECPATPESPLSRLRQQGPGGSPEPSPPPRHGSIDFGPVRLSVVQRLICDYRLQPSPEGAIQLESLLKVEKIKLLHKQCLKTLCQRLGTANERDRSQRANASPGADIWGTKAQVPYPSVQYTLRETIESRDKSEQSGNVTINEDAKDAKYGAAKRVLDWIDFVPIPNLSAARDKADDVPDSERSNAKQKKKGSANKDLTEVMVEERCGILVKGMFWGHKHVKESENRTLEFLQCLHLFGTSPRADYAVRLSGQEWQEWGELMAICLLSGECKVSLEFNKNTGAQLAMNTVPTLTIFILVHLSTRTIADQPMPPWMWTYGFVYTEKGVTIYAHFPKLVVTDAGEPIWKFVALKIFEAFSNMWVEEQDNTLRMRGLAVFDMMRSHTQLLLEHLLAWSKNLPSSAIPIMNTLIARAHLEIEDYDWLKKRAQEKDEQDEPICQSVVS